MEGETPAATTRVFIGNLPLDCTTADIEAIMRTREWSDEVIRKCDVHLVRDRESDKFKGFCYADVGTPERAKEMLELNGADFAGRRLKIDLATPKDGGHRGGRGGRGGPGGRGGFRGGRGGEGSGRGGFRGGPPRDRRESDRERRGPRPPRTSEGESHNANNNVAADEAPKPAGRPRLQLKPRCTDPAELEAKRQREAEEEAARKAKLFQA